LNLRSFKKGGCSADNLKCRRKCYSIHPETACPTILVLSFNKAKRIRLPRTGKPMLGFYHDIASGEDSAFYFPSKAGALALPLKENTV
jgi:hypothetical protein